ncbi:MULTISPECIES: hypothetical protein [Hydrocarboniphaga]|uniref:Uncharacterized protein n=1 Tax=Hydrocarboniphaga effusa AP103 TaxID=1172194 RepID=I8T280_9GAMM|nr:MULTISPECIES: hypothetical protein [Hydrocarboniphaga]EIT67788.1 hypothetical protein WQQ_42230 [Hydrocarboniphaga effusa AP103]MDZ4080662.1 hypothetical protein [Hydrocarboniphaga sp.]
MPSFSSLEFVLPLIALTAACGLILAGLIYTDKRRSRPVRKSDRACLQNRKNHPAICA